jgi:hypothetical protein
MKSMKFMKYDVSDISAQAGFAIDVGHLRRTAAVPAQFGVET